jgi:hypothetical protein
MQTRIQRLCAWCGPIFIVVCGLGLMVFCGFVPPPSPSAGAAQIADQLRTGTNSIRFGLLLMVFGSAFLAPFVAVVSVHMKRIEGPSSPLTYVQLVLGTCLIMEFIFPMMAMQAAAYRPERAPEIVQTLSDLSWMTFYGVTCTAVLEALVIGVVILADRRAVPLFPRWSGFLNIWVALLFTPGSFLVFFKTGPLAWNGLCVFWMPFGVFFAWIVVMTWLLLKAVDRQSREVPGQLVTHEEMREELTAQARRLEELTDRLDTMRVQTHD